jgi:hypothetical protein
MDRFGVKHRERLIHLSHPVGYLALWVDVRRRPGLYGAIVTQLVTRDGVTLADVRELPERFR